jgi:hypothetical protein
MQDIAALALLPCLTLDGAAQLMAGSGSGSHLIQRAWVKVLIRAVEDGDLRAVIVRAEQIDYWNGNHDGPISPMETTVQRADLDDLCQKKDYPLPGRTTGQAGSEAGDEATAGATAATAANTSAPASSKSIRHRPASPLTAVIEMARKTVSDGGGDGNDYLFVWLALIQLAESPNRPAPLVGYAEGDVKYSAKTKHGTDVVECFSKDAMRQWMKREVQRQLGEREADAGGR